MAHALAPEDCPDPSVHGNPFRYCPYCSWMEALPEKLTITITKMVSGGWYVNVDGRESTEMIGHIMVEHVTEAIAKFGGWG